MTYPTTAIHQSDPSPWNSPTQHVFTVLSKKALSRESLLFRNNLDINSSGSSSTAIMIYKDLLQLNKSPVNIKFPQFGKVLDYLLQYPNLAKLIRDTCIGARAEFGPETQLSLEYEEDLEFIQPYLVLFIRKKTYTGDFMDHIDNYRSQFDEEICRSSGDYFITTDFQNPR
jgi:hypothetical protein